MKICRVDALLDCFSAKIRKGIVEKMKDLGKGCVGRVLSPNFSVQVGPNKLDRLQVKGVLRLMAHSNSNVFTTGITCNMLYSLRFSRKT